MKAKKMKNPTKPDYDSLLTFLSETPVEELVHLAQSSERLDSYLLTHYPEKAWGNVAPDSQEANDAATASGEMGGPSGVQDLSVTGSAAAGVGSHQSGN